MKAQFSIMMTSALAFSMMFLSLWSYSQLNCSVFPADTVVCYNDSLTLTAVVTGEGSNAIDYKWQKDFTDIAGATDSVYTIAKVKENSPGLYRCIVTAGASIDTSNNARLSMHPRMYIDTLYRHNQLGCFGECKGQFKVLVSGGTPFTSYPAYIYDWHAGFSQDTIVFGLCPGNRFLSITDSMGCVFDTGYFVEALKSPKIQPVLYPGDTLYYYSNPTLTVSFHDSVLNYLANWIWRFGDGYSIHNVNPASHTYTEVGNYDLMLSYTDQYGCDSSAVKRIIVWPSYDVDERNGTEGFIIYPNPGSGEITLEIPETMQNNLIENSIFVYDLTGREMITKLFRGKKTSVNIAALQQGVYFIKWSNPEHLLLGRFLKE